MRVSLSLTFLPPISPSLTGICHSTAVGRGISHARLPIDEFLEMKTRKVLTVNHVFDILASASSGKSWKDAFIAAIPSRKGAVAKEEEENGEKTTSAVNNKDGEPLNVLNDDNIVKDELADDVEDDAGDEARVQVENVVEEAPKHTKRRQSHTESDFLTTESS